MSNAKNKNRKYIWSLWFMIIGSFSFFMLMLFLVAAEVFGPLPSFEQLENPDSQLATEIYSADNQLLGKYFKQNRTNVEYENLPKHLVEALICTEDVRYHNHAGVDGRAMLRVIKGVLTLKLAGGGSTISQQLAKNMFPRERLSKPELVIRKLQEWVVAAKLEKAYTKREIMTMYFNIVSFSDNAYGIRSAAKTYFNKQVDSLNIEESAVLVGMLKAPTAFNPRRNPEKSTMRRNVVLGQMRKYGRITPSVYDSLTEIPLTIDFSRTNYVEGLAPYFRMYLRQFIQDWSEHNRKPDGSKYDLDRDGLKIYTTIDSRMQQYAEEAAREHLASLQATFFKEWKGKDPWKDFPSEWKRALKNNDYYRTFKTEYGTEDSIKMAMNTPKRTRVFSWDGEKDTMMTPAEIIRYHKMFLRCGILSMDPSNGQIKAWVGGPDYRYFQYDHVRPTTKRQIGSTFKPFVYAVAIDQKGYSPCQKVPNELVTFEADNPRWGLEEDWTPKNSDARYGGFLSLKQGLANSVNTISAYLMHETGPQDVINLIRNMGVQESTDIPAVPSICLGTPEISLYEMVGAYGTFANLGMYIEPNFITRIEDKNGNVLEEFHPKQVEEALSERTAYLMTNLLQGVVQGGSGVRLRYKYKMEQNIAGKTGTTQNHSDGWFMGYTPELVTGIWVGCEDRFVRFKRMRYGQGANMALPIWALYNKKVYDDLSLEYDPKATFRKPTDRINFNLDCNQLQNPDADPSLMDDQDDDNPWDM